MSGGIPRISGLSLPPPPSLRIEWLELFACNDIDDKINLFNTEITALLDKYAPVKTFTAKNNAAPWMTVDISKLMKCRDKARRKHLKSNHAVDYEYFRQLRNKVKQQIRNAKVRYYHSIFDGNPSPKKMWSTIRSLGIAGGGIRNVKEYPVSADSLNEHYLNVSSIDDENLAKTTICRYENLPNCERELFHFKYVTPEDIKSVINSITSSAVGADDSGSLESAVLQWRETAGYQRGMKIVKHLLVVCDYAEQGVKLFKDFNKTVTKKEELFQDLVFNVDAHIKSRLDFKKSTVVKKYTQS
ncbi:Phosphatidylserine decarboxylase proenzyme 2 [Frankliniella fusca]|uniref:Phosphatidylserine decarboxylase proenzyme 2 n=1 Tax=Frankliniella fusca TaxID=407009 RepID=A0AAE1HMT7_9NEOP|nr:Phosphatidylserine decarboxylase proenzyme 2 [Frankliniella fusca]